MAENSSSFEEDKSFLLESLISGTIKLKSENPQFARLNEINTKELIDVLTNATVGKSKNSFKSAGYPTYMIRLTNEGYKMSYDLAIFFMIQKNNETNEVLIIPDFSNFIYVADDLSIYNKIVELLENNPY